jgi:hypothetical protein
LDNVVNPMPHSRIAYFWFKKMGGSLLGLPYKKIT